jgi:Icc-related predicted phosphoesterase
MRCVAISDTHNRAEGVAIPSGDVLLHAGDLTMRGTDAELLRSARWLSTLRPRYRAIVAIPGNHDLGMEDEAARGHWRDVFAEHGVTLLSDEACTVEGVNLYGSPWQPWFLDWGFNFPRDDGGAAARATWAKIPDDTDLLLTHGPPHGILDQTYGGVDTRAGCPHLLAAVRARPRIRAHVFGHIHEGYGQKRVGGVLFVNAATCDRENYAPVQPPITFEFPLNVAEAAR